MSRALGAAFSALLTARETGEVIATLLTIDHPALQSPLRFVDSMEERLAETEEAIVYAMTSRGEDFLFMPFRLDLHNDTPDAPPAASLTVPNIDRAVVDLCRAVVFPRPTVQIDVVAASDPDTVEIAFPEFEAASVDYDASAATITLGVLGMGGEPYPAHCFTPAIAPGLF